MEKNKNQLPRKKFVSNARHEIESVNPYKEAEQTRVLPRQLSTGSTRGQQQIYGSMVVRDGGNTVRLLMGFKKGAF